MRQAMVGSIQVAAMLCAMPLPGAGQLPGLDPRTVDAQEKRFLTKTRQLTLTGRRAGEGYFSPDGSRLVFQSEREPGNPFFQIYLLDFATGATNRVSPGVGKTTCAFIHPVSGRVLFASTHLDPSSIEQQKAELEFRESGKERRYSWDYDPQFDLFETAPDGSGTPVRLTETPGYDAEGAYSPDGGSIVFTSNREIYSRARSADEEMKLKTDPAFFADIYTMKPDGTGVRRLTSTPGYDGGPFFAPDGSRIVWRRFDEKGFTAEIWTMKPDGSEQHQITTMGKMSWAPYFHPSMEYILFASNKEGFTNFELYIVDAKGRKEPVRVTHTAGFDGLPVPSPDGKRLVWTSNRGGGDGGQLWMANWNHAEAMKALAEAPLRSAGS